MSQYARVKAQYPDAFLFFRLGDFYEMFFEDAVEGARLLGLTLTSRNRQDPDPIPMCGVPWHQRDAYVARLLRLGHKVAICDQLGDAAAAKGLVERGVTEMLTPGSVVGEQLLAAENNFLAALNPAVERVGVALCDASTGEVRLAEAAWSELPELVERAGVAEWLVPSAPAGEADGVAARLEAVLRGLPGSRSPLPPDRFAAEAGDALLGPRWGREVLASVADLPLARGAAAAALDYLDRVQGGLARQMRRVERLALDTQLRYDQATARHLELFEPQPGGEARHTLWRHLNLAVTAMGVRRLRGFLERPLAALEPLLERQEAVEHWLGAGSARAAFREELRGLPDLERLAGRVACAKATPRDLGALRDALRRLPALAGRVGSLSARLLEEARAGLQSCPDLLRRLEAALVDDPPPLAREGGIFRAGYDPIRDQLEDLAHSGKRWIAELEASERARTGIPSLKVGFNKVFGYYLEVTRPHLEKVPADYERRQTLTTAERFATPGLKAKEDEVLGAEEKLRAREHDLFVELRAYAAEFTAVLQGSADALATLDALAALAEAAARYDWRRPLLNASDRLQVRGGRHPVVERLLPRGQFVPNDLELDGRRRQILLLTGPNMGGKSTYLRQAALIVLLAQVGSFTPAESAEIGLVDRLFTRVGAADRLGAGQSTFLVEMLETAQILRGATPRSLVLLDEVGRGTATYDGLALAWAVTEHLHASHGPRPRTLFATHYHELTQLAETLPRLANIHVQVKEWGDQVVFLHQVAAGPADRSYGIHVAQMAGMPGAVTARAKEVLAELEAERTAQHLAGGPEPTAARRARAAERQAELPLFPPEALAMLAALKGLDPERLTPLQALQLLNEWKERWGR
jgi:DNA mismatch repair protein MutS